MKRAADSKMLFVIETRPTDFVVMVAFDRSQT